MLKTDEPKRLFERKMQVDVLKTTSPKNNKVFILPKKKIQGKTKDDRLTSTTSSMAAASPPSPTTSVD